MVKPAEFINTIVIDILETDLSSNKFYNYGGSKNTLWQCVYRNTSIGSKVIIVLSNLIESEIKYDSLKKGKILKYIKSFLNDEELEFMKNNINDFKTLIRFVSEKINDGKCGKMLPDFKNISTNRFVDMYDVNDSKEKLRLEFQKNLTRHEDLKVFESVLKSKKNINILDVGCNNGNLVIDRIESLEIIINKLIGIDSDKNIIDEAKEINGNDVYSFYCADAEKNTFQENIKKYMAYNNIKGFDLVCLSMVLLHLNKPYNVLKNVRKVMNKNSTIFIRDIDDSLTLVSPDKDNLFEKTMLISDDMETTGYRKIGREIYMLLKKAGFNNISIHPESINTLDMNHDDKEALFNTNFSFILGDLPFLIEKYPNEKKYKHYYSWLKNVYDYMEESFQSDDFFYQMGTVLFTANK